MTLDCRLLLPLFSFGPAASLIDKTFLDFGAGFFLPLTGVAGALAIFFAKVFVAALPISG